MAAAKPLQASLFNKTDESCETIHAGVFSLRNLRQENENILRVHFVPAVLLPTLSQRQMTPSLAMLQALDLFLLYLPLFLTSMKR